MRHLVYLLVSGGERVFQGWAEANAPEDSVDGVIAAGEACCSLRVGLFCLFGPDLICMWAVWLVQIQGVSLLAGQHRVIHWHRQSMANPRW